MKILFSLLTLGALALTLSAQAQTRPAPRKAATPAPRPVMKNAGVKDGVTMQQGKVMVTEHGHTVELTAPNIKDFPNGTKVQADGVVVMADGNTSQLQEGDYMSLSGRITTARMKAEQDSLMQAVKAGQSGKAKVKSKRKG
ncbi:DUF6799 domain-containing protein [Solirubrum puertoriconensis]|uniref:DUF6799 domain-containing protein n=1 Tax=Solirubrum puertoriconensis TaxID=1751427 RepID=A0A9X0HH98_SOLP1|nr:DUF6799 domain-containing protein [Solirubrum puertoriconensis]KUG05879.1 hypothetical protein ASU33_00375 [Solirubrum puertoriconensis]